MRSTEPATDERRYQSLFTEEAYQPPTSAQEGLVIPDSDSDDRQDTQEATITNKLAWGAAFGILSISSQMLIYWFFSLTSSSGFSAEVDRMNFIPESSIDNLFTRTLLSNMLYFSGTAAACALGNLAWRHYKSKQKSSNAYGEYFTEIKEKDDINYLFQLTAGNRELKNSLRQDALKFGVFVLFILANYAYNNTYKDVGDEAISLLPNFGLQLYKFTNQHAGDIGFLVNFALSQWFNFVISNSATASYNQIQMIRNHYTGSTSWKPVIQNIFITETASVLSSLAFFFLALNDPDLHKRPAAMQLLIPLSAFIVYGAVLNTKGSIEAINDTKQFWSWLNTLPEPFLEAHKEFKKYKSYVLGYLAYNVTEYFKEAAYYVGLNNNYIHRFANEYSLPKPEDESDSALIPPETELTSIFLKKKEKEEAPSDCDRIRPRYSNTELKQAIENRIKRDDSYSGSSTTQELQGLIARTRTKLDRKRLDPSTVTDVWKYGRVRKPLAKIVALTGPLGLSVVLFGYYFLVNKTLTETVYNKLGFGLSENGALARMLSLYLFYPFIKLVHNEGYGSMQKIFNGAEHKVFELCHSVAVLRGKKTSVDFAYQDRAHPITKKETALFALATTVFALQLTAFLVTPSSSGSALYLLQLRNYLNPFTASTAFWFTALFNSLGIANFLSYGEEKLVKKGIYRDRSELFQQNDEFFEALENPRGCRFDLGDFKAPERTVSYTV